MTATLEDISPQVMVKTCSPSFVIAKVSLPDVDLSPDQFPEAAQEDALLLLHVMTAELPRNTLVRFADMDAVEELLGGTFDSLLPPPPQAFKNKITIMIKYLFEKNIENLDKYFES
ncbi:hypothetical protein [uncultured Paraglaciecola sp.]|uniref:hypothetical protein n=1 Tax=uncultured Paraglaciecola sp. TaxID=1765024 RepID=UPI0025E031A8|nr:hypothetical protein [uncultured Paraglaciecola sp.]